MKNLLESQGSEPPIEQKIREMLGAMIEEKEPIKTIPVAEVPEFSTGVVNSGIVEAVVPQGAFALSTGKPLRTDNMVDCNVFIMKTKVDEKSDRYALVHVWAGDLAMNHPEHKRADIAKTINSSTEAIAVTGSRSASPIATARELRYEGAVTRKRISVESGNRWVSVVFRPQTNEVLVRLDEDPNVLMFKAF